MDTNSLEMNLLVTLLVGVVVFLLPWADRRICRKLGLNLEGGLSENPNADRLLRLRQRLLVFGLVFYLLVFAWLVFFSRNAAEGYSVHIAPLEDLKNAFSTPTGFSGWFRTLFTECVSSAFSQISIVRPQDIYQFYLNMLFFVPMGFMLPYVFRWFRARVHTRPALFCLLVSFMVENLQLITRRGLYDFDDIISNTIGGLIGQALFIVVGYAAVGTGRRKNRREFRAWKRNAYQKTILPYIKETGLFRATLFGSGQAAVLDYYAGTLGFRLLGRHTNEASGETVLLFGTEQNQVEIVFRAEALLPDEQHLVLFVTDLASAVKRLEQCGVHTGPFTEDPCTGKRTACFSGPDNVQIRLIEAP